MERKLIYVDHAATTYIKPEVLGAMQPYLTELFGNPSSIYYLEGKAKAIDEARSQTAYSARILKRLSPVPERKRITGNQRRGSKQEERQAHYHSAIEHHAVLEPVEFCARKVLRLLICRSMKTAL